MFTIDMLHQRYHVSSGWSVGPSPVASHILMFMIDGSVDYRIDGRQMMFHKNDLVFIPIGLLREAKPCPPHYHKMCSAHFRPTGEPALPFSLLAQRDVVRLRPQQTEYIKQRFSALADLWSGRPPYCEWQCQGILLELLALASRELDRSRHDPGQLQMVQRMERYIEAHYRERITLEQTARVVERSPNYACHLFKKITGFGPIEYANHIRLNKARELLLQTDLSVAEIAAETGFADPYYFSKLYKRAYGMSPKKTFME